MKDAWLVAMLKDLASLPQERSAAVIDTAALLQVTHFFGSH